MEKIKALMDRIDNLSIRERGIILAGVVFIMYTLWNTLLMQPQIIAERKVLADLQMKRVEQSVLNIKFQGLVRQGQANPDVVNRERLEDLKKQLDEIESDVRQSTNHLVSPANMAVILQTILNKSRGLQLTEIKGLGVSPLLIQAGPSADPAVDPATGPIQAAESGTLDNAYKHGLVLTFEGDYMSTLAYMRELEALEWGFFWESLQYEVTEYPKGKIVITLYTISLEKDWIGV